MLFKSVNGKSQLIYLDNDYCPYYTLVSRLRQMLLLRGLEH